MTAPKAAAAPDRDAVERAFWARFLEAPLGADGKVSGFARWWANATTYAKGRASIYVQSCWKKISGGERDVTECVAAGVSAFRADLRMQSITTHETKDADYAAFRFQIFQHVLRDGLRPFEVAALLEQEKFRFVSIGDHEIEQYREWGSFWGGEIPAGRMVWNPRSGKSEPWPHVVAQEVVVGAAPAACREGKSEAVVPPAEGINLPASDDDAPPPE